MSIRRLRIEKAWSQSELAEFSGLSLRTIQRIEKGEKPSAESLKALAAVFGKDVASFSALETDGEPMLDSAQQDELKQIRKERDFYLEVVTYLIIIPLMVLTNWLLSPDSIWSGLAALGWGIWLAMQGLDVFGNGRLFGPNWEKQQLEKRLNRKV